jgi:hypothetical protein
MLREEGEHVPKALPQGFEAATAEGEPRCYAARATARSAPTPPRSATASTARYACGLGRHIEQVAKLP